ncbi:hypothetical protein [Salibacter sp.]|jgi:hypothetical protein|uniref:hypothetical protein n=1 Tax=Salibacter sp. TaxID=2010995 RepID=UPI00287014DF|nr:hypothetical protein [Salibacter sp.]MDR9398684.1 hypothetical protein [Salibacter sp.]MDR9487812.1 hypothetical protein [Salibacter sp.]
MRSFFVLPFLFLALTINAQEHESVEDLAKDFVKALRKMETSSFIELYEKDSVIVENFNEKLGFNYHDSLVADFSSLIKTGLEKGIDWNKIKFVKAEYITRTDGPFLIAQPTVIIFQHRLFRYAINMNCSRIEGDWGFVPIKRKVPDIYIKKI